MNNNYQKLRVTLPNSTDLADEKVGLTDFAIYSAPNPKQFGPRRTLSFHEIDAGSFKRYAVGDIWLQRVSTMVPSMMLARESDTGLTFAREVDATNIMAMPQLQNFNHQQFGTTTFNQQQFLTVGNKVATYPTTVVKSRMADKLSDCVTTNDPAITLLGSVRLPAQASLYAAYIYQYAGQNYVYAISKSGDAQWFNCEPLRVKPLHQGSRLQCLDGLFVTPFADYGEFSAKQDAVKRGGAIDTDHFAFGQYLNFAFTENLQQLALPEAAIIAQLNQAHKLRHLVANFTQAAKKLVAPIIER